MEQAKEIRYGCRFGGDEMVVVQVSRELAGNVRLARRILEALEKTCPQLKDLKILRSSDSHYLETLATGEPLSIHLPELSCRAVVEAIRQGKGRG